MVFLETEIWPNMLRLAHRRGTPTLLLSGRFSARSVKKYSLLSWFFRGVLGKFYFYGYAERGGCQTAPKELERIRKSSPSPAI